MCPDSVWMPLLIALVAFVCYTSSFEGAFVFDDWITIEENPAFSQIRLADISFWTHGRPIGMLTFVLNHRIHGDSVFGYHVVNLAIHIMAGVALYALLRRLFETSRLKERVADAGAPLAFASALLWTVHPLQTQSVTYIIQRYESLAGLFYLLCVYLFLAGVQSSTSGKWLVLSALCCWLGIGTKEILVTAPLLVLIFDRVLIAKAWREIVVSRWWYYLLLTASWIKVVPWSPFAQPLSAFAESNVLIVKGISPLQYAATQPGVLIHYLQLSIWPQGQCIDPDWPIARTWQEIVPPALVIGTLLIITCILLLRNSYWSLPGVWFFGILGPTSSFLPIKDVAFEHRMYLSLAALTTLFAVGGYYALEFCATACRWNSATRWRCAALLLLLPTTALGVATFLRNVQYHDRLIMWSDVVSKAPHNARAYVNLGSEMLNREQMESAIPVLRKALELDPNHPVAHFRLAFIYHSKGNREVALAHANAAAEIEKSDPRIWLVLGYVQHGLSKLSEAEFSFRQVLKLNPQSAQACIWLARIRFEQDDLIQAQSLLTSGLQLENPTSFACNLQGALFEKQGQLANAKKWFERAVELEPTNATFRRNFERLVGKEANSQ